MNFSIQKTIYRLLDQLSNWLLIMCMKVLKGYKHLQFDKSKSEDILKFDKHDNDEFIPLFFPPYPTKPKHQSTLGKGTRTLTYLLSLQKSDD